MKKVQMVCLGLEPGAGWLAQTNPLTLPRVCVVYESGCVCVVNSKNGSKFIPFFKNMSQSVNVLQKNIGK